MSVVPELAGVCWRMLMRASVEGEVDDGVMDEMAMSKSLESCHLMMV